MTVRERQAPVEMAPCNHVSPVGEPNSDVIMIGRSVADALPSEYLTNASITRHR